MNGDLDARAATAITDCAARDAAAASAWAALERQDDDYHALVISISFNVEGASLDGEPLDENSRIEWSELSEDEALNASMVTMLIGEINAAIAPLSAHYHSMDLIRADNLGGLVINHDGSQTPGGPVFFLVHHAADTSLTPEALAEFSELEIGLKVVPGGKLTVAAVGHPFNATMLFDRAQRHGLVIGDWGRDEGTPELTPPPDESRDAWLARVSMPADKIKRNVARWERSGGNLDLFNAAGAASGRTAREKPIRWLIPGLIPRGYVSLLVGTKQAGKSTLLGEMLAVIDSECQSTRSLLGIEITARGIGVMVSGEDGIDFVANRNTYYEPVHGDALGFTFATSNKPWREILKLIDAIPHIDIIGIDPLRAVMPGNEDSSEAISLFLDELNGLAQRRDCAIVLVHHLSKVTVRSLSAMLPAVRGSGAITDRPRMVIGMIDRGAGITEAGIIKHNIPPSEPLWGDVNVGRLLRRDKDTLTLVPVEMSPRQSDRCDTASTALDLMLEAVRHQNRLNVPLRRTGKSELFERKAPQLAGLSRSIIRDGITTLLASGRLADGAEGLQAIDADAA